MRIVSLLPSATEIVYALGADDALVGVTFECDHPPDARTKAVVSGTALPADRALSAREVDHAVTAAVARGEPIYTLDVDRIRAIAPDLILAQDLCRVCAVPSGAVEDALEVLGCRAQVVSLDPTDLEEVVGSIGTVGAVTEVPERARTMMAELWARIEAVRDAVAGRSRPRVLALEWSDPPFSGGHWVPDMIIAAGGEPVLATTGRPSERISWETIAATGVDVVVYMPCGYDLASATAEGADLLEIPALDSADAVWSVDATAYFSRPGPRVVEGVELLASLLHPAASVRPPSGAARRLRPTTRA